MKKSVFRPMPIAAAVALATATTLCSSVVIAQTNGEIEEVIVQGSLGSLPGEDVEVFGFGKSLLKTPRSASTVSAEQLERFNVTDIDELVAFAPGTFTQSFFGVAGSLDVRGTPGETYFRGVKRLDNPGNYPTPIGASSRVDIVRGPASPIFGPAKIGGYLNFNPKSSRADGGQFLEQPEGEISYTTGTWDKSVISAEVGGPLTDNIGYYVYGEVENSDSFYDNTATDQTILQASFDMDVNENLRLQWGGMYHDYEGNQVAGWNRLTQDLIDNGTYITGSPTSLDTNGDGSISHQEYNAAVVSQFVGSANNINVNNLSPDLALQNVGTAQLDRSNVLVAPDDTLENEAITLYFDVIYNAANGWEIKNQLFYDAYDNLNENAYGFSQFHDSFVIEDKLVFAKAFETDSLTTSVQLSPSIRYTDFKHGDDFTNEFFDRRDLTGPSTALDRRLLATRIDDDYTEYYEGSYADYGLAALVDFTFDFGLSAVLGVRYDFIDIESRTPVDKLLLNNPTSGFGFVSADGQFLISPFADPVNYTVDDITAPISAENEEDAVSWNVSLSYETPIGLIPYVTFSEQTTVIAGQGAEINTANVASGASVDSSTLEEYGLKGSFLNDSLYFALAYYEQERTDFNAQAIVTNSADLTEGIEAEIRWVVNEALVLTAGYSKIEVTNLDAEANGGRFSFFGAEDLPDGIDPSLIYGGVVNGIATSPTARKAGVPENIYTLTGTYDFGNGFAINSSIIRADETFSGFSQAVELPAYTLVNAGIFYENEKFTFSITGKNLTDEEYFRANFPNLFGSQIVLPELPRHYQASVAFKF
ncbi:TonB-dependent receptor [Sessilibacter sp. MAH1]